MRRALTMLPLALVLGSGPLIGQQPGIAPPAVTSPEPDTLLAAPPTDPVPRELQFIGYSFTRTTTTNIAPTSELLQGQVIGRLFGTNTTNTVPINAFYTEQRFVPYLVYTPRILNGDAVFRFMGKIDYTWGDQAYGVGNNRGGAINAGQVNLQTLMANLDLRARDRTWNVVVGLQRVFDNAYDPHHITLEQAQTSGYKLAFWGTNAVGVNLFATPTPGMKTRVGVFQLWENLIARDDDVTLFMADMDTRVTRRLEAGANAWYLRDRAQGGGGISVLGQGLNSALAEYNGATRLRFATPRPYNADIVWLGGRAAYNRDFLAGRWWADAFAITNVGAVDTVSVDGSTAKVADVLGVAVNASLAYKYGMTAADRIWAEAMFTTGDGGGTADGKTSSVLTGNVWGSPVGIYSAHRALLLFPDAQVVSRYYSAVHDISNAGRGVAGFSANASRAFIPNRFVGKVGTATAFSNTTPTGGGNYIGTEINGELRYQLGVLMHVGLNAGYLLLGDYYDAPAVTLDGVKPSDPWTIFLTLSWMMF
jgi:hypothetical protein